MRIKTNIAPDNIMAVSDKIKEKFPNSALSFELENEGKVLHIHGLPDDDIHAAEVESAIKETGFSGSWIRRGE